MQQTNTIQSGQQSQPMTPINQNLSKNASNTIKDMGTGPYKRISQYNQMPYKKQKINSIVSGQTQKQQDGPSNKLNKQQNLNAMANQNYNQFNGPCEFNQQSLNYKSEANNRYVIIYY